MLIATVVIALIVLAGITLVGAGVIERRHRPDGEIIEVPGGRLHVVTLGPSLPGQADPDGPPLVLLHGASSNLRAMRQPLGDELAKRHRVILIDRPGHGFSTRDVIADGTPSAQAAMIDAALGRLGIERAVIVAHSWAGSVAAALALDHPARVAGLVMLAPVTHPWKGEVAWYNRVAVRPLLGGLFVRTVALPAGLALMEPGARDVFAPQPMPVDYVRDTAVALLFRPAEFLANAHDMVALKPAVAAMAPRYGAIRVPVIVLTGDADTTVSPQIHARAFAASVPGARLELLSGVGHMPQNAASTEVIAAIERLVAEVTRGG